MLRSVLRFCALVVTVGGLAFLSGCAANRGGPSTGAYVVIEPTAEFFKYGPAQSFGPDLTLKKGERVTMLDRSWGFSRVLTENGMTGYVASECLKPAPPLPASRMAANTRGPNLPIGGARGGMSSSRMNRVRGEVLADPNDPLFNVNDVPLPVLDDGPPKARPDFRTTRKAPEEAPPPQKPKFR